MKDISLKDLGGWLRKRLVSRARMRNPAGDWTALLFVALILTLLMCSLSVWMYLRVRSGDFSAPESALQPTLTVDRAKLSDVLSAWRARSSDFERALSQQPSLVDPRR